LLLSCANYKAKRDWENSSDPFYYRIMVWSPIGVRWGGRRPKFRIRPKRPELELQIPKLQDQGLVLLWQRIIHPNTHTLFLGCKIGF
jgi:hypothetical protein